MFLSIVKVPLHQNVVCAVKRNARNEMLRALFHVTLQSLNNYVAARTLTSSYWIYDARRSFLLVAFASFPPSSTFHQYYAIKKIDYSMEVPANHSDTQERHKT